MFFKPEKEKSCNSNGAKDRDCENYEKFWSAVARLGGRPRAAACTPAWAGEEIGGAGIR